MNQSGYSGTPLAKKLGIKEGYKIRLIDQPAHYFDLFTDWPAHVDIITGKKTGKDMIHYFIKKISVLEKNVTSLRKEIYPAGMLWISWPKKASKVETDVTEDLVRKIALSNGLVDIKVCAVDETWSGLKLVVPIKERTAG